MSQTLAILSLEVWIISYLAMYSLDFSYSKSWSVVVDLLTLLSCALTSSSLITSFSPAIYKLLVSAAVFSSLLMTFLSLFDFFEDFFLSSENFLIPVFLVFSLSLSPCVNFCYMVLDSWPPSYFLTDFFFFLYPDRETFSLEAMRSNWSDPPSFSALPPPSNLCCGVQHFILRFLSVCECSKDKTSASTDLSY